MMGDRKTISYKAIGSLREQGDVDGITALKSTSHEGLIHRRLAAVVPAVSCSKLAGLPRYLEPDEVKIR